MEDPAEQEAYWRGLHDQQPFAEKTRSYENYAHAYRTGYESLFKYAGKKYEDVEDDIALNYEKSRPESALPWDSAQPAVKSVWDRLGGVITPRDVDRGARVWI